MLLPKKAIQLNVIIIVTTILLEFIVPILLLTKIIPVEPNAKFAHLLLLIAIPITFTTILFQLIYFKLGFNQVCNMTDIELKKQKLLRLFTIRMAITLIAIIPNFIFLLLTNLDLFLFLNIVLALWMIYLFPFSEKIADLTKNQE